MAVHSRAGGLRNAEISVYLGGATADLPEATLDPAGAYRFYDRLGGLKV